MAGSVAADARLSLPVAASWIGAWSVPLAPLWCTWAIGALAGVVVVVAARARWPWWVLVAVGFFGLSAVSMGFRLAQLDAGPIAEWAASGRRVDVMGVLTSDPVFAARPGFGGGDSEQAMVELRVEEVTSGSESLDLRTPVLVLGGASGWRDLHFGDVAKVSGTLHPVSRTEPLAAVMFTDAAAVQVLDAPATLGAAESMRSGLREAVADLPPEARGLVPALVIGDTTGMPRLLTSDLRTSGLAHLTAVSGANVAMVVGLVLLLARWAGVRAYALVALGLATIVWFVLLARPQPSVLRAAAMGTLALVAVGAGGKTQALRSLLAAVLVLLLLDPWLSRSWGFALSVAATAGLVLLARRWSERLPAKWPEPLRDALAVALAAQAATLPLVMALSGNVALLSVCANVLAAPAVPPATVLGAASAAVAPVSPWLASVTAWLAQWPARWIAYVAERTAVSPLATVPWPDGWCGGVLGIGVLVGGWAVWRIGARHGWWRPSRLVCGAVLAVVLAVAYLCGPGRWPPPGWVMVACDVGQGDALAVNLGAGSALVVDAGPDPSLVDRCLDRLGVQRVPLLVLTHFHADHVEGLPGVLDGRSVGRVVVSPLREPAEQVEEVAEWIKGIDTTEASPGQTGSWGVASWRVIWSGPPDDSGDDTGSAPNNASVVLAVEVDGVRLLLTGDVEPEAQEAIAAAGVPKSDVLKVPHHGSQYQDGEFLAAVGAEAAIVSVGEDNTYGHPDAGLLDALADAGMVVARTDEQGAVAVVASDDGLRVVSMP